MKINEVIAEGPLDSVKKLGGAVKNAVAGYQAGAQQRQGAEATKAQAKTWIDKWNAAVGANPAIKNDPAALQNYGAQLARNAAGKPLFKPELPTNMSPAGVNQYITSVVGRTLAATTGADAPDEPAKVSKIGRFGNPKADTTIDINGNEYYYDTVGKSWTDEDGEVIDKPADIQILNKVAYEQANPQATQPTAQPAATGTTSSILGPDGNPIDTSAPATTAQASAPISQKQALAQGVKILSDEPIVIQYKNKDFGLNDNGQWIHLSSGKIPQQAFQAFLSKQHDSSLGL